MRFCNKCDNMYYLKIQNDDNTDLVYYCRNCGDENIIDGEATTIMKTVVKGNNDRYINVVNKYTKYDNTLPRVNELKCPNTECGTNNEEDNDIEKNILLIRVNEDSMKYINLCSTCNTIWDSNIK